MNNRATMSKFSSMNPASYLLSAIDCSDFRKEYTYYGNDLGLTINDHNFRLLLWAPLADSVHVLLFSSTEASHPEKKIPMERGRKGTWETILPCAEKGKLYLYQTSYNGKTGGPFVDPYAHFTTANGTHGCLLEDNTNLIPEWNSDRGPVLESPVDAVIYEASLRDFTSSKTSGSSSPGKFNGFTEKGTSNSEGFLTGLDHLKDLGITHVQLMPSFDFEGMDDLTGIPYNWGYNPRHFNTPKGGFSSDPKDPRCKVVEMKKMIQKLHSAEIGCVMDVVFNHTARTEDSAFHLQFPYYFHRMDRSHRFSNGSGCGNELATERPMVRKFIIDCLLYWMEAYHIDGFRFDLMGLIDQETIRLIVSELRSRRPDILLYGEGWTGGESALPWEKQSLKVHAGQTPGMGYFNDDFRDVMKGHVFERTTPGFTNGGVGLEEAAQFGMLGSIDHPQIGRGLYSTGYWAASPCQSVNYVCAHDNLTLFDKVEAVLPDAGEKARIRIQKLNLAAVFLAQGIPFLHSGVEWMRTKQGEENSYNLSDAINALDWDRKSRYLDVCEYCRGLISMRKQLPGLRMRSTEEVSRRLSLIETGENDVIGFLIEQEEEKIIEIAVYLNARPVAVPVNLPESEGRGWMVICDEKKAGIEPFRHLDGNAFCLPARSACVLVR